MGTQTHASADGCDTTAKLRNLQKLPEHVDASFPKQSTYWLEALSPLLTAFKTRETGIWLLERDKRTEVATDAAEIS